MDGFQHFNSSTNVAATTITTTTSSSSSREVPIQEPASSNLTLLLCAAL